MWLLWLYPQQKRITVNQLIVTLRIEALHHYETLYSSKKYSNSLTIYPTFDCKGIVWMVKERVILGITRNISNVKGVTFSEHLLA